MRLSWWGGAAVAPGEPGLTPCPQALAWDWAALDLSTCREWGGASGDCNAVGLLVKGNTESRPDHPTWLVHPTHWVTALPFLWLCLFTRSRKRKVTRIMQESENRTC